MQSASTSSRGVLGAHAPRANVCRAARSSSGVVLQLTDPRPVVTPYDDQQQASPCSSRIRTVVLPPQQFAGFGESFQSFAKRHRLDTAAWNACDATAAQRYISYAHAHTLRWLPPELIFELQSFFVDPASPPALFIRGLPLDAIIPPTPVSSSSSGPLTAAEQFQLRQQHPRLPVAESVVLGVAKAMGDPFTFGFKAHKQRGGLVTDMTPTPHQRYKHKKQLAFHQDFPAVQVDGLVLMGVRGDSSGQAFTHVCDNRALLAALGPADAELLRRHLVTLLTADGRPANDSPFTGQRQPWWHAVSGREDDPVIKLYEPELAGRDVYVSGACTEVTGAYNRLSGLAAQRADKVLIGPGDLLAINNQRAVHAPLGIPGTVGRL